MPKYLETVADKFTFRVATDRLYTREGVWVLPEPDARRVRVGVADYLQQHNGDVAFAHVKPSGTVLKAEEPLAQLETIKAMVDLYAPVSGLIAEINGTLNSNAETPGLRIYETGLVKEGVGAGGASIAAMAKTGGAVNKDILLKEIERNYASLMNIK